MNWFRYLSIGNRPFSLTNKIIRSKVLGDPISRTEKCNTIGNPMFFINRSDKWRKQILEGLHCHKNQSKNA